MIINKVKLCNFGSFEDEVEFDISVRNEDKNVILIGGRNGSGKTTLFTAIKIALYGHTAFGYQSANSSYFSHIRINKKSLLKRNVNSFVSIDLELEEERETANYVISREWTYENKRLRELHSVTRNGIKLNEDEIQSFESFLKFMLPPQLFDLFFFDGEKISDFFLEGNSSKNLREALLILCGYDNFDIIKSNFKRNMHKELSNTSDEHEYTYAALVNEKENVSKTIKLERERLSLINIELGKLQELKLEIEKKFRKAGGLLSKEIADIKNAIAQEEKFREDQHEWLKNFANEALPFLITEDLVQKVKVQVVKESTFQKYNAIKDTLSSDFLRCVIQEELLAKNIQIIDINSNDFSQSFSELLSTHIREKIKPDFDIDQFKIVHSLSKDDEGDVLTLIKSIEDLSIDDIKRCKEKISDSIKKAQELRKQLELCEGNDQLSNYIDELNSNRDKLEALAVERERVIGIIQNLESSLKDLDEKTKKAKEILMKTRKDASVVTLCDKAQSMLECFIPILLTDKLEHVKKSFIQMFKTLISKQGYIDDIDIDTEFHVTLYRNGFTTKLEIENLISNLGIEGLSDYLGEKCIHSLINYFGVTKKGDLEKAIKCHNENEFITLPLKVDINGFSKGEQQIYIMALYWALVKLANNNIPFIIDTPYARIDEIHRANITTKFFPSLSNQVIILSTDSEVNSEYYKLLKPHIAKQYTISYSDEEKRTYVHDKYFSEVAS